MRSFHCFPPRHGARMVCALLSCVTLAACGGGGGGASDSPIISPPVIPGPVDGGPDITSGLRGEATDLLGDWAPEGVANYTALSAVPTTGSASYTGYLYGDLSDSSETVRDRIIGTLTLDVSFTATAPVFDGTARDFVDTSDDPLSGTLSVSGGTLNRNGNPASDATLRGVAVAGTLQDGDGTDMVFGLQLEGDFLGTRAAAIGGEAIGRVSIGSDSQDFDGGFIAED